MAVEGVGGAGALLAFEGFFGAGAAVEGTVLRGVGGGFGPGALFAHAAEVDDLGHAAILARQSFQQKGSTMAGWIELTAADGHKLAAWRDGPDGDGPGLVVVQEIFGVNQHIRNLCTAFAAAGYSVIAPAMFDRAQRGVELGYTADDIAKGRDFRGKVPDGGIILDIEAAAAALGPRKIGIVGYCFGGTVAWWGATRSRRFSAASGWYGGGVAGTRDEVPNCAVQLHFGEKDTGIPMPDVEAVKAAQPGAEIHVYAGAQHGFACDERGSFSATDAAVAQARTLGFFARHLG